MNNYSEEHKIGFSDIDSNLKLNLEAAMRINQNLVSNYFYYNNLDNKTLKDKYNSIMVISRIKLELFKPVNWNEIIIGNSYMTLKTKYRMVIESEFTNKNVSLYACKCDACLIDYDTREIINNSNINVSLNESVYKIKNSNLYEDINSFNKVYELKVLPTDIDFSNHVNNTVYVRYILNSIDYNLLKDIFIEEFEINYINEALLNDMLTVYNKIENNYISFIIMKDNLEIVRAKIKYKK